MKTLHTTLFLVALLSLAMTVHLFAQDPAQTVAPPRALTPEDVQASVLKWIGVATVISTALAGLVAHILARLSDLKSRADRQAEKTGKMNEQIVDLAKNVTPPVKAVLALLIPALLLSGCANLTPDERAGWNRVGQQAAGAAVGLGMDYARHYATQHDRDMEGYRK